MIDEIEQGKVEAGNGKGGRLIGWMFTIHNNTPGADQVKDGPTAGQQAALDKWLDANCKKYVYQEETGDHNKKLHFQGAFLLTKKTTWNNIYTNNWKKIGLEGAWLAPLDNSRGGFKGMWRYCMKNRSRVRGPWKKGEDDKSQGQDCEYAAIKEKIKAGTAQAKLADEHPKMFIRHASGIVKMQQILQPIPQGAKKVFVHIGPTCVGKTTYVFKNHPPESVYPLPKPNVSGGAVWWQGYDPTVHKVVLIDEFYGGIKCQDLLEILDKAKPIQVFNKNGSTWFKPDAIYITSNVHWEKWYAKHFESVPEHKSALHRRFDEVRIFQVKEDYEEGDPSPFNLEPKWNRNMYIPNVQA